MNRTLMTLGVLGVAALAATGFRAMQNQTRGPVVPAAPASPAAPVQNQGPLYPVQLKDAWGFLDATGRMAITPRFALAHPFHEGAAQVCVDKDGNSCGLIDARGAWILKPEAHQHAEDFSEGLAWFDKDSSIPGGEAYLDSRGRTVITLKRSSIHGGVYFYGNFHEGFARVLSDSPDDDRYSFMDKEGRRAFEPKLHYPPENGFASHHPEDFDFSNGVALAWDEKTRKFGFVNAAGGWAIAPRFEDAGRFSEGLAIIRTRDAASGQTKSGFINREGKVVVAPRFAFVRSFSDGVATVSLNGEFEVGKWGYIDPRGNFAIAPNLFKASDFKGNRALAAVNEKPDGSGVTRYGVIDKRGTWIVRPTFTSAELFENGWSYVEHLESKSKPLAEEYMYSFENTLTRGFIDTAGAWKWKVVEKSSGVERNGPFSS